MILLSKRAQYTPTPHVVIEPIDPLVQKAVNDIKALNPSFFMQVEKIVVHFGGGAGHLGYVKRGPNENPRIINIYKDRIKEIIQNSLGGQLNAQNFEEAVKLAIIEVLGHEQTHVGQKPEAEFAGEPEAERGGKDIAQKLKPQWMSLSSASVALHNIRDKYLPSIPMSEPTLSFVAFSENNDQRQMVKEGIRILCDKHIKPAIIDVQKACAFNKNIRNSVVKHIGLISHAVGSEKIDGEDFVISLASYQASVGLEPTGKLDKKIIKKMAQHVNFDMFPRNFGIVIPNKLYRGGLIRSPEHIKALMEHCGIQRIVSLHNDQNVLRMCGPLGVEYIPAYLENGKKGDLGRKIFGESVYDFLTQKPTYIHCFYGEDRTGGVIARLRTESGWPCKLAYLEAKSYGFKDIFTDLIDWFCEPSEDDPPVDTDKIRERLNYVDPYQEPELSQNLLEPTPTDMPFGNPFEHPINHTYVTWGDTVNNITPSSMTPPLPVGSHGK
jgi:hypothetical protein